MPTMPARWRRHAAALAAFASLGGCAVPSGGALVGDGAAAVASLEGTAGRPAGGASAATVPFDPVEVQHTLDVAAAAFAAADPRALVPALYLPDGAFGKEWQVRAANLADVPLTSYRFRLDDTLPDLATAEVRSRYDVPVVVLDVREEYALEGFDASGPSSDDLYLTFARTPEGWRIAADADAEPLGLVSVDHLWDHGPVVATRQGALLALHHPETTNVLRLLRETQAAMDVARSRWPLRWPGGVPVIVPRDEDELAALLHVTYDLSNFIAFSTATPVGDHGDEHLTGTRIVVNPARFLDRSSSVRERILVHELTHVATRPVSGPMVPAWLEEGIAQALGEQRSTTGTSLLDRAVARGFDGQLPTEGQFTTGGRDRVFLSYQLAWSFVEHLRTRYSAAAVARFYQVVGEGSLGEPGTRDERLQTAAQEVFGTDFDALRDAWAATL